MLEINFEEHKNGVIVILNGELSFSFVKEFEKVFDKYYNSEYTVAALDLKDVLYLDSFGISRIIKVSREFKTRSIDFVLINVNDNIHQILRMATFDKVLNIMSKDVFVERYFPGENSLNNSCCEIIKAEVELCSQEKKESEDHVELVDINGTTLVFLD
jgi:anti-anti-sigma factor